MRARLLLSVAVVLIAVIAVSSIPRNVYAFDLELYEDGILSDGIIEQGRLIRVQVVTAPGNTNQYRYIWTHTESGTTLETGNTVSQYDERRINILGDWNIKVEFYYFGDKLGEATTSFRIVSADYNIELFEGDDLSPSDGTIPQGSLIRANAVTTNPTVNQYRYIWTHTESGTTLETGNTVSQYNERRINILGDWNIKVEFYYFGDKLGEATTSFRIVSADYNIELFEGDDLSPSDGTIPQGSLIRANAVTTNPTVNQYRYIWTHTESGTTLETGNTVSQYDERRINILGDWNIKVEFYYFGDKLGEATTSFRIVSADYNIELFEGDDLSPSDGTIPQGSLIRANAVTTNPTVNQYRYIWTHTESGTTLETGNTVSQYDERRINILGDWNIKVEFYYFGDKLGEATTSFRIVEPTYNIELFEGDHGSDYTINLGQEVRAKATTNDNSIRSVTFRWIDPSNNEVRNTTVNIVSGEASDTYTPNQVGTWQVIAEFSDGTIVVKELQVPFQVVPESIIGALSVIGSSLAVLAVYRRKRSI
jgi:hypothetical protein